MKHKLIASSLCLGLIITFTGCDWCTCSKKIQPKESPKTTTQPEDMSQDHSQAKSPKDTDIMPAVEHSAATQKETKMMPHPIESLPIEPKMPEPKLADVPMPAAKMPEAKMPEAIMPEAKV